VPAPLPHPATLRALGVAALALVAGCRIGFDERTSVAPDGSVLGPWATPVAIPVAATAGDQEDAIMSSDLLELYFSSTGGGDLLRSTRAAVDQPWSAASRLPFDADTSIEASPRMSADQLTLYFAQGASLATSDVRAATRASRSATFDLGVPVTEVNTPTTDKWFSPCAGGRYVMVHNTPGNDDLYEGVLGAGPAARIDALDTPAEESSPFLTADCLTVYFSSDRTGTGDVLISQRTAIGAPWSDPVPVEGVSQPLTNEEDPWVSPDGRTMVFTSDRAGSLDVYLTTR
jgi:hypothetical protein